MHAYQRENLILKLLGERGFISFTELQAKVTGSPASLRRDLTRLAEMGRITRVHGGARLVSETTEVGAVRFAIPAHENAAINRAEKEAIGRAAADLCKPGEAIMIDSGSTTLQMCQHLDGAGVQVLTSSLQVLAALLPQAGTRLTLPGGAVFREQGLILSPDTKTMPNFHASKLFMGAAAVGPRGVMQADPVVVASTRALIARADEIIVLVDSSKFEFSSGNALCELDQVDVVVTDPGISSADQLMLKKAGVRMVIAS